MDEIITLTALEQRLAKHVAQARDAYHVRRNAKDVKATPNQTQADITLQGVAAEIAFCKLMNIYPYDLIAEDGNLAKEDATFLGRSFDVKTTRYRNGHLVAVPWKAGERECDAYALMAGEFPAYTFKGITTADKLFRPERFADHFGHGKPCYAVPQTELQSVPDWLADMDREEIKLALMP